jgi:replication-associated recombination protein RarA
MRLPIPFSAQRTVGGYLNGEVASALQKEIRRGNEREALFWATELELSGNASYVWKRLLIIASEDVGIADSNVALTVRALYENWLEMSRKVKEKRHAGFYRVFLAHAVCLLARAPKSRMLDHALMVMYEGDRPTPPIPDYAIDKHTAEGRRRGRGTEHFFDVGAQLANVSEVPDPYAQEARARHLEAERRRAELPPDVDEEQLAFQHPELFR